LTTTQLTSCQGTPLDGLDIRIALIEDCTFATT